MQTAATDSDPRVGTLVGNRWRLEQRLGEGGMATVYAARNTAGARVAVKVLHQEMTRRQDVRARFLREAYVANRIGHPGAVQIVEHGEGTDTFLVMELLEGEPLSERVKDANDLTLRTLLGYADQILDVLAAAHAQGVIHRDIKPDNVFVTKNGQIKILDFGIARVLDDVPSAYKTRTGIALGTVPYMAPEQALGKRDQLDGRVDIFALGSLLFRVLAGRRIHEAPSEAELLVAMATQPAPPLGSVAPAVPTSVCAVVDKALAYSRDARYPDARTMQSDVRAVLSGQMPPYVAAAVAVNDEPTRAAAPAAVAGRPLQDSPTRVTDAHSAMVTAASPAPIGTTSAAALDAPVTRLLEAPRASMSRSFEAPPVSAAPHSLGVAGPPPSAAPHSLGFEAPPVSAAPYSLAGPPSSVGAVPPMGAMADAVPMSMPAASLAMPVGSAPASSKPKSRSAIGLVALLALALLFVAGIAVAAVVGFGFWSQSEEEAAAEMAPSPALGTPASEGSAQGSPASDPTAGDVPGAGQQPSKTSGSPATAEPKGGATPGALTADPGAAPAPAEPTATAAAKSAPVAPADAPKPSAPTAPAAAPTSTSVPSPPTPTPANRPTAGPATPPPAAPAPPQTGGKPKTGEREQPGKGKGKSKPK